MKKLFLLSLCLFVGSALWAQWVYDPINNTFLANTSTDAGEIYTSTDPLSGDTYVQWTQFDTNGWSPSLQRISADGTPQWGTQGIHIGGQTFSSWSEGIAMTATRDHAVVSCFSNEDGHCIAVRINEDGTFPWGEEGVMLFNGQGGSRTEVMAGEDGGVWALGADYDNSYLQYVNADGTLNPLITISDPQKSCMFGLMVPTANNGVFVVYEKETWAYTYYYNKEIFVAGFLPNGSQISADTQLMNNFTIGGSYAHYVVPDGLGGGYVYIWHPAMNDAFNTYVFHFDQNGLNTIGDLNGVAVHSTDPANFYFDAYATVDPESHDLLIAYEQTDATYQSECKIMVNRITTTGEILLGDGVVLHDNGNIPCTDLLIDAFEDGTGFAVMFAKGADGGGFTTTVEALGFDMKGDPLWNTTLNETVYNRTMCENSTGFIGGQNIVVWVNSSSGGLYGQNLLPNGDMGSIPQGCPGPENFQGEYQYDMDTQDFGALLSWDEPTEPVEYYRLYRTDFNTGEETIIEFEGNPTSYYDACGIGIFEYQLRALYANLDCGYSMPATTPTGEDFIRIEVTSVKENNTEPIVTILNIYTMNGQLIRNANMETLGKGIYILQGLTPSGQLVTRKTMVD